MDQREQGVPPQTPSGDEPAPDLAWDAPSEFLCPGCGRPLDIVLHSTMCFAEAQVYCPDCERDFQLRRGKWREDSAPTPAPGGE